MHSEVTNIADTMVICAPIVGGGGDRMHLAENRRETGWSIMA